MNVDRDGDTYMILTGLALLAGAIVAESTPVELPVVLLAGASLSYGAFAYSVWRDPELRSRLGALREQIQRGVVRRHYLSVVVLAIGAGSLLGYPYASRVVNGVSLGGVVVGLGSFLVTRKQWADQEVRIDPTITETRETGWYRSKKMGTILATMAVCYLLLARLSSYTLAETRAVFFLFGLLVLPVGVAILVARKAYDAVA